jgi:hypothetical protein
LSQADVESTEVFGHLPQRDGPALAHTIQINHNDLRTAILRHNKIGFVRIAMDETCVVEFCE